MMPLIAVLCGIGVLCVLCFCRASTMGNRKAACCFPEIAKLQEEADHAAWCRQHSSAAAVQMCGFLVQSK